MFLANDRFSVAMRERLEQVVNYSERRAERRAEEGRTLMSDDRAIMAEVRMIGAGLVTVLIIALVLNEVYEAVEFETDADGNYEGPFGPIVDDLETTGVAALSLLVVGFIIVAASAIMRVFGGSGMGGR